MFVGIDNGMPIDKKSPLIKAGLNPYLEGDIEEIKSLCCSAVYMANFKCAHQLLFLMILVCILFD